MVQQSSYDSRNQLRSCSHPGQHKAKSSCTEVVTGCFTSLTHKSLVHKCPSAELPVNSFLVTCTREAPHKPISLTWLAWLAPVGPLRTRRVQLLAARGTCSPTDGCWREKQLTALGSERWREDTSPEKVWRLQDLARLIGESLSLYEASR